MRTYSIYALIDPRTNAIRYVGSTAKQLQHRLSDHYSSHHGKAPRNKWIKEIRNAGLRPIIKMLEEVQAEASLDAYIIEQDWITKLRNDGNDLLNKPATR